MYWRLVSQMTTALAIALTLCRSASAHPHVFVDAALEIATTRDGHIAALKNEWLFDAVFSSSVVVDFDRNSNDTLDADELASVAETISGSLKDYGYFLDVTASGKPVRFTAPTSFGAEYRNGQLLVSFSVKPLHPVPLKGNLNFGVYDPTYYTAIDIRADSDIRVNGPAAGLCRGKLIRPDPDKVLAQQKQAMTEAFFANPGSSGVGKLFGTRLYLTCGR